MLPRTKRGRRSRISSSRASRSLLTTTSGDLRSIAQWRPDQRASPGGRLIAASHDKHVIGFALSQRIDQDISWRRLDAMQPAKEAAVRPSTTVIAQELAVEESFRGRGIAKQCIRELPSDRTEHDAPQACSGKHRRNEKCTYDGVLQSSGPLLFTGDRDPACLHQRFP